MEILRIPAEGLEDIAIEPGQVTVIAANRQSGKSTFAAQLAEVWAKHHHVCLCVLNPRTVPTAVANNGVEIVVQYDEIDSFACRMRDKQPDVIILDEVALAPRNPRFPARSDVFSLQALAAWLRIPIVCVISRNPLVDALLSAATITAFGNEMPKIEKEAEA